nr:hypothetical protein [Nocardia sp. 348MFTsu5.1]
MERIESGPGGDDYYVRPIAGQRATKIYRCPGCNQTITVGVPHVVAWPVDDHWFEGQGGDTHVDDRRHWHTGCWRRGQRGSRR